MTDQPVYFKISIMSESYSDMMLICASLHLYFSVKFGRKMMYINYLHELKEHLHFDQLKVPPYVLQ